MNESIASILPLITGLGLIVMGLILLVMPSRSVVKLDRAIESWVSSAPNPNDRVEIVADASRAFGAFVSLFGLTMALLSYL